MSGDEIIDQQRTDKRRRRRGIWITLGLLFFILIVVPVGAYLIFLSRAASLAEAELAKLRAEGYPVSAEDLHAFYEYPPPEKDVTELWMKAAEQLRREGIGEYARDLPIVWDPETIRPIPPPGEPWDKLEAAEKLFEHYAETMDLLHQAAARGGAARYDLAFEDSLGMSVKHALRLRNVARFLALQAHVRAHRGDPAGVAQSILSLLMLGKSLQKEPTVVSQLKKREIEESAFELVQRLLPHVAFTQADLRSLQTSIEEIDYDAAAIRSLHGDRALAIAVFQNPALMDGSASSTGDARLSAKNDDMLLYLELMDRLLATAKRPCPQRLVDADKFDDEVKSRFENASYIDKRRYAVTELMLTSASVLISFAEAQALANAADLALAIEQFSRKNDRLPKTLDELVPEFIKKVPIDPFDGKPMKYVVRDEAYVIYSIGEDRVDDGGEIIDEQFDEWGKCLLANPDIIFPVDRVEK